jgi:hypothetical protein
MLSQAERLTMLQGSLTFVINASSMSDIEKDAARLFVDTMVPHIAETTIAALEAAAKIRAAEKKVEEITAAVLSKQPEIVVKTMEAVLADAAKTKWKCW